MKTTIKLFFVLVAISLSFSSYAQKAKKVKTFSGVITYDITYEGEDLDAATMGQLPTQIVVSMNGNKVRNEQISAFYSMASISDLEKGSAIILIDAMGMKIGVNQTKEEIDKNKAEADLQDPVITILDETKVIAGYKCKKAEVTMDEEVMEVYFTDEIAIPEGMNDNSGFKGINGMLMQYSINQQGLIMTMTVKEVKKTKVKAGLFLIPDDYEIKTMEELGGMLGG